MGTTTVIGGGNHKVVVFGNGTVIAGNGNDTITITGVGKVIAGNGNDIIRIGGAGSVIAGNGNDSIAVLGHGEIAVGSGHDAVTLAGSGAFYEKGLSGNDTITLGLGKDTIFEAGHATVHGVFGDASISGGTLALMNTGSEHIEHAFDGKATLVGGLFSNEFIGGTGTTVMKGGLGPDTFVGGSGIDTMTGGASQNVFEFLASEAGGHHIIKNFVSGQDQLYLEGHSLSYLQQHHDIYVSGGNTYISLDGGKTSIELQGVTKLDSLDITKHKP